MRNAFSVDVEDWYQVSDFEEVVDFSAWGSYESRVVRNTERVLELLDARGIKGTFFILTWNAERHPELVRTIAATRCSYRSITAWPIAAMATSPASALQNPNTIGSRLNAGPSITAVTVAPAAKAPIQDELRTRTNAAASRASCFVW